MPSLVIRIKHYDVWRMLHILLSVLQEACTFHGLLPHASSTRFQALLCPQDLFSSDYQVPREKDARTSYSMSIIIHYQGDCSQAGLFCKTLGPKVEKVSQKHTEYILHQNKSTNSSTLALSTLTGNNSSRFGVEVM